jgi:hypothetical protein
MIYPAATMTKQTGPIHIDVPNTKSLRRLECTWPGVPSVERAKAAGSVCQCVVGSVEGLRSNCLDSAPNDGSATTRIYAP